MEKVITVNGHDVYIKKLHAMEGGGVFFLKISKAIGPALMKAISETKDPDEIDKLTAMNVLMLNNPEELWPLMVECVKTCKIDGEVATDSKLKECFPDTRHFYEIFQTVVSLNYTSFFN